MVRQLPILSMLDARKLQTLPNPRLAEVGCAPSLPMTKLFEWRAARWLLASLLENGQL